MSFYFLQRWPPMLLTDANLATLVVVSADSQVAAESG